MFIGLPVNHQQNKVSQQSVSALVKKTYFRIAVVESHVVTSKGLSELFSISNKTLKKYVMFSLFTSGKCV